VLLVVLLLLLLLLAPCAAYNKNYIYAENTPSRFLQFPTRATFDHRRT
jgi:hypothetical protein